MAAVFGGFAGSLVTGGLTIWLEHRRQLRGLRAAARLVAGELRIVEARLHVAMASGTWHELRMQALTHDDWDQHRSAFAAELPLGRWSHLHTAYVLVAGVSAIARSHQESDRLTFVERQELGAAADAATAAAAELEADSLDIDGNWSRDPVRRIHRFLLRHP